MKRTAILAHAASASARAEEDLKQWQSFLISSVGGGWKNDTELAVISNPSKEKILREVRLAASDDYVFVVFLGSGELRKDRLGFPEVVLSLGGSERISERELNPLNDRCSILIDVGRGSSSENSALPEPRLGSNVHVSRARNVFEGKIQQAEKGCVKIYASSLKADALNDCSFSSNLINESIRWAGHHNGVLDLHEAALSISGRSDEIHSSAGLRYQGGRRLHHFPFAVNPSE